jgi:hypothetical protein
MDDDEFARLADNNKSLLEACSDPNAGLRSILQDHDVVYALYPSQDSPLGWDKAGIKGQERPDAAITAIWCTSLDEAMALSERERNGPLMPGSP